MSRITLAFILTGLLAASTAYAATEVKRSGTIVAVDPDARTITLYVD